MPEVRRYGRQTRLRVIWTGKARRSDSPHEVQHGVTLTDPSDDEIANEVSTGIANGWRVEIYRAEEL